MIAALYAKLEFISVNHKYPHTWGQFQWALCSIGNLTIIAQLKKIDDHNMIYIE